MAAADVRRGHHTPPPETVPLTDADFASEAERDAILAPVRVTDEAGRILPCWGVTRVSTAGAGRLNRRGLDGRNG